MNRSRFSVAPMRAPAPGGMAFRGCLRVPVRDRRGAVHRHHRKHLASDYPPRRLRHRRLHPHPWVRAATCTPCSRRTWQTDSTARFLVRCSSMNTTINADGGRDPRQAVDTYRAFSSFLLGQLRLEPAVRGAEIGPTEEPLDHGDPPCARRRCADGPARARARGGPTVRTPQRGSRRQRIRSFAQVASGAPGSRLLPVTGPAWSVQRGALPMR